MMRRILAVVLLFAGLIGCTPDELSVKVPVDSVRRAVSGGLGTARARVVYSVSDQERADKLVGVARRYLGEDGTIETRERKNSTNGVDIVACFTVPVGTRAAIGRAPKSLLRMVYTPETRRLELCDGESAAEMSRAFSSAGQGATVTFSGDTTLVGGWKTRIWLIGDQGAPVKARVYGAFVNDKAVDCGELTVSDGKCYELSYLRYSQNVWGSLNPAVTILQPR